MNKFKYTKSGYNLIDSFTLPNDLEDWLTCPMCGLKPKTWVFDNGRHAACGCHNSLYDHRTITAEPIMEYVRKNKGSALGYDSDLLRKNWNNFIKGVLK